MTRTVTLRGVDLELFDHEAVCSAIDEAGDFYEAAILDDLRDRRPAEATIVDIGAHLGNHSVYWSAFVPHEALVAIEPVPMSYVLLVRNLGRYLRARTVNVALSDASGDLTIAVDLVNMGRSHVAEGGDLRVPARTLDSLGLTDVSFIKVDVEGHQRHVLMGGHETLARWHPALLVEDAEEVVAPTLARLGLAGYRRVMRWPGANDLWEWA